MKYLRDFSFSIWPKKMRTRIIGKKYGLSFFLSLFMYFVSYLNTDFTEFEVVLIMRTKTASGINLSFSSFFNLFWKNFRKK